MAFSGEHKYFCVLQLAKTESIITVQRGFRTKCHTEPPTDITLREWYREFEETRCSCAANRTGRSGSTPETGPRTRILYRSPQKSTRANRELQQDGAPPHFYLEVCRHHITTLPQRWIGRTSNEDSALIPWSPRSPDLTPCDFFLWGYVKDKVYLSP
jgi:hypothetical protein